MSRNANLSLWANGATTTAILLGLAVVVAVAWSLRDEVGGLVAALFGGLLLAPYTLVYALTILLLVPAAARPPGSRWTAAYALPSNPALVVAGMPWLLIGLALSLFAARRRTLEVDQERSPGVVA